MSCKGCKRESGAQEGRASSGIIFIRSRQSPSDG